MSVSNCRKKGTLISLVTWCSGRTFELAIQVGQHFGPQARAHVLEAGDVCQGVLSLDQVEAAVGVAAQPPDVERGHGI